MSSYRSDPAEPDRGTASAAAETTDGIAGVSTGSTTGVAGVSTGSTDGVAAVQHTWITEDWLATIVGLTLLLLFIAGVLPKDFL